MLKKSSIIEDMEGKYSSSSECGGLSRWHPAVGAGCWSSKVVITSGVSAQRVEELEEALKKKDEDMKQMEERYKKYLEKAKSVSACSVPIVTAHRHEQTCPLQVIRTLDPKQNQGSGPEVQALKNQLQEKERMLLSLEVRLDQVLRWDQRSRCRPPPPHRRRWTRPKVKGTTRRR